MDNLGNIDNSEQQADNNIKSVQELQPVDITLHPIYRQDGIMLVNRYTTLMPLLLNQIQRHLNGDKLIPIIVASSDEQLDRFLKNETYSKPEFIMQLDRVVRECIHTLDLPLSIEAFVDERVDIEAAIGLDKNVKQLISDITRNELETSGDILNSINPEIIKNEILLKLVLSTPNWSSFEFDFASEESRSRAKDVKEKFLNLLHNDKSLMELTNRMASFEESMMAHSMNAACTSILFGISMGLCEENILELAIAALFSNIGFVNMNKTSYLEHIKGEKNPAVINEHIKKSLEIIASSPYCRNKAIIFGILDHHEYYNGSGSPTGKKEKDISLYGRILRLALEYDGFLKEYLRRERVRVTALMDLENKYDPDIINAFKKRTKVFHENY